MAEGTGIPVLEPPPARFNIARYCLGAGGPRDPAKTALVLVDDADAPDQAERWSFAELDVAVRRVAAGLLAEGLGEKLGKVATRQVDEHARRLHGRLERERDLLMAQARVEPE